MAVYDAHSVFLPRWRKPGKREGRWMTELKTARNSIGVNENALWRKDKPTFYALSYCHGGNRGKRKGRRIELKQRVTAYGSMKTYHDAKTRRPSMPYYIGMKWRQGNLLCEIISLARMCLWTVYMNICNNKFKQVLSLLWV